jgi:hypothetical protein
MRNQPYFGPNRARNTLLEIESWFRASSTNFKPYSLPLQPLAIRKHRLEHWV